MDRKIEGIYALLVAMLKKFPTREDNYGMTKTLLSFYAEQLISYSIQDIAKVCNSIPLTRSAYPTIAAIIKLLDEEMTEKEIEVTATRMTNNLINAMCRHSYYSWEDAKEDLNDLEIEAVRTLGGWYNFSANNRDITPDKRKHIRDSCYAVIVYRKVRRESTLEIGQAGEKGDKQRLNNNSTLKNILQAKKICSMKASH